MSNGVNFRKLALDLRDQLDAALAREARLKQRLTVQDQRVDELEGLLQMFIENTDDQDVRELSLHVLNPTAEAESHDH